MTLIYDIKPPINYKQVIQLAKVNYIPNGKKIAQKVIIEDEAQRIIDLRLREYKFFTREPEINDFTLDKPSILQFPAKLKETNATD
uniref:Uncharacterized protein n=1 Tax=viral metagenome TaxID=1070528 RepID=A0A6M3XN37_9ZZZZ